MNSTNIAEQGTRGFHGANPQSVGLGQREESVADYIDLAESHYDAGDFAGAISAYTRAIELDPKDGDAYYGRARANGSIGEHDLVIADCGMAIELGLDDDPCLYFCRACAYHAKGDLDRAVADYSMAISLEASLEAGLAAFPLVNRGNVFIDMGDYGRGIADYTEAIRLGCDATGGRALIARAHYNRGLAYRELEDNNKAIADFTQAIWLNPSSHQYFYDRGNAYSDIGDCDRAISDYTHAITIEPSCAEAYCNRGSVYGEMGDLDNAIADWGEAIRLEPNGGDSPVAHLNLGLAHSERGNHELAIASLSEAIELDPDMDMGRAWHIRGLAYQNIGDLASASADLAMANKLGYYSQSWA